MSKKNRKRYCIDEKLNRQMRRARTRTKTGILLFLSTTIIATIGLLVFAIAGIFRITQ